MVFKMDGLGSEPLCVWLARSCALGQLLKVHLVRCLRTATL